jgi:hypothetical protein
MLYLLWFNFEMINKPGASIGKVNALSRRPDHKDGVENNNEEVTLLKPEFHAIWALQQGHLLVKGAEEDVLTKVWRMKELDELVGKAVAEMKRSPVKRLRSEEWLEEHRFILF